MQGQWHPLTALWIRGHTPAMLQRFIDYQRQPRQLLTLPARLVAFSAAAYILLTVTTGEREHIALYVMLAMLATVSLIEVTWWVTHRKRANRS